METPENEWRSDGEIGRAPHGAKSNDVDISRHIFSCRW